ncbi:MAG TPA: bifunctional (p)ppGpp synthetase/guanosine-3',5'-bis(diphosphate) 3'-pyrophosphohydrolase [Burkholderiales bacterium]|nr:bifunctional (p)ppGpp synthetase/guanosine-3',5'-bis(diphosphate) 3'-pyrophosphohydrolase [Burkholderiales bacterium]
MSRPTAQVIPLPGIAPAATADATERIAAAQRHALAVYGDALLGTGENIATHAEAIVRELAQMRLDDAALVAGWLFAVPQVDEHWRDKIEPAFGAEVAHLVDGLTRLHRLRDVTRAAVEERGQGDDGQIEILRKMLLAMVADVRVVLIRLASRTQTLRYFSRQPDQPQGVASAREALDFYAPLANRLGVWQLKWELEDLSFRLMNPEAYRQIAGMLAVRRTEREGYIAQVVETLREELAAAGIQADVAGRPKHIYSIYNKMRQKSLSFDDLYDVRALRVLVDDVKDCYAALGVVHNLWQPIPKEFDDYISRPKGNNYRSLHTAVIGPDDLALEVQIRTHEMHRQAELGVAAHWRYKEAGVKSSSQSVKSSGAFDEKVALLRQLLAWRDEVALAEGWRAATMKARLDDTIYVLTPQGRVIDLPQGATPIDFAYALHTDLGHRCRGARVDGAMVPLNTALATGQRVEIITAKTGGPSRDWLNPNLGYLASHRARTKVRQWFNLQELEETSAQGRVLVEKELQRIGRTGANLEQLAQGLGFKTTEELFVAAARGEWSLRQIGAAFEAPAAPAEAEDASLATRKSRIDAAGGKGILIVGVDRLMTQLAKCCKPAPPDPIIGFVTRGKGVSIHRADCSNFANLRGKNPERVIETQWGAQQDGLFAIDVEIEAHDRPGLLRDIGEVFSRESVNVTATRSASRQQVARMALTVEVAGLAKLNKALDALREVPGVTVARRV